MAIALKFLSRSKVAFSGVKKYVEHRHELAVPAILDSHDKYVMEYKEKCKWDVVDYMKRSNRKKTAKFQANHAFILVILRLGESDTRVPFTFRPEGILV